MQILIKKWGNSAAVRIPAAIMETARLHVDAPVDVREVDGRIIIEPIRNKCFDLAQLLAGMTPDNLHAEADFGPAAGKEMF